MLFVSLPSLAQELTLVKAVEVAFHGHPAFAASTFFTLLVVPVLYNLVFGRKTRAGSAKE